MLLRQATLTGIREGRITLAFRRQRRPTVRTGGTLLTAVGVLAIDDVRAVDPSVITLEEAYAAGHSDLASLESLLAVKSSGTVYRFTFRYVGPDPRIDLRETIPDPTELGEIRGKLGRMDARSGSGPWTIEALRLIRESPAVRAADLAPAMGMETQPFKARIRKLKGLGLTESLEAGYRLSPRGTEVLRHLEVRSDRTSRRP